MTKVIVASFKEESKAIKALHKLVELESFGDISIYERIMVRKKADGVYETLKEDTSGGWRTLTGLTVGGVLGMLGGPVGFVIGLITGTLIGGISEINHYDFAEEFIDRIESKMPAGEISIIAEIYENSNGFIDSYLIPLGATIMRSDVDFEFDKYINDEIDKIDEEIADSSADLKNSIASDKKAIEAKIADLKNKRNLKISEFETKSKNVLQNMKDKAASGIKNVKSEVTEISGKISKSIKESKESKIKRRIAEHETKLKNLNIELKKVQV
jgi:uncharacterized membrane protein